MRPLLDNLDDRALVQLALDNRQEAYTRLLLRYKDRVQSYIHKLVPNAQEAEDLVLMSFDRAFQNLSRYNPTFAFSTWLYSIVQNLCIDHLRKTKQYYVSLEEVKERSIDSPEEELINEQQRESLDSVIARLKPTYREVFALRYMQHYAYEEIAKELGLSLSTVKTRLHRAKEMINQILKQQP